MAQHRRRTAFRTVGGPWLVVPHHSCHVWIRGVIEEGQGVGRGVAENAVNLGALPPDVASIAHLAAHHSADIICK